MITVQQVAYVLGISKIISYKLIKKDSPYLNIGTILLFPDVNLSGFKMQVTKLMIK